VSAAGPVLAQPQRAAASSERAASEPDANDAVRCQYQPEMLDLDALLEVLVELVNLPEAASDSACFSVNPMESCG